MSDNIDIPISASGEDGINRVVSAIDRMHASLEKLGAVSGVSRLEQQIKEMQASVTTGFATIAAEAAAGEAKLAAIQEAGLDKRLNKQLAWEAKQHANANKYHDKQVEIEAAAENRRASALQALIEKRDTEMYTLATSQAAKQLEIQQRRDVEMYTTAVNAARQQLEIQQRRDMEEYREAQSQATKIIEIAQRRDVELHSMRQRAAQDAASEAEKQRLLNTAFLTGGPTAALQTAQKAAVYSNLGGNATEKYGSAAATADIKMLQQAHDRLAPAARQSADALREHNIVMSEGHALARGLSGSLGALWLTYGSIVPLAAGAAIAASLRSVVTAGKEVEYQLKFVEALGGGRVNLDSFLAVTDSTVVSVKEAAEGMRALAQNGLNANEALKALPAVLNLSVIGEMGVAEAALAATGAMSAFGLGINDLGRVGDIFAKTAATSNTSVAAMTESMRQASTVASIYNVSIEETSAALGTLAKINIIGSAAGTAYTNMLNNLYAPSKQAAKALKELGVTTDDGMGGLKNSTKLLGELKVALGKFNEPARASLIGDITTARGAKAMSTILDNLDLYKTKIGEAENATGFMSEAVAKLEDSTTGAFKRLANSASDSLNRAFASASPALQDLLGHLAEIARSDGAVTVLTALADATLRLTKILVDHAGTLALVTAGYLALRLAMGVSAMFATYSAAAAVATTATMSLAAGLRLAVSALGFIGLAIAAATVVWQIFVEKTTEVEKADQRIRNSIATNIEYLERETRALTERNKAWNPETQRFDRKTDPESSDATKGLTERVNQRQKDIDLLKEEVSVRMSNDTLIAGSTMQLAAMEKAQMADKALLWKETALAENHAMLVSEESARTTKASLLDQVEALAKKGEMFKTVAGEQVAADAMGNEKSRAYATEALSLAKRLKENTIDTKQGKIELLALEQKYNSALQARAPKVPAGQAHDEANAQNKLLEGQLQLAQMREQAEVAIAQRANKRGELGDLELITLETEKKVGLDKLALEIAQKQANIGALKPAQKQEAENKVIMAKAKIDTDTNEGADRKASVVSKMAEEERTYAAETMRQKGQYVEAYLSDYEAKYKETLDRLDRDIKASDGTKFADGLVRYKQYLLDMGLAAKNAALGQEISKQFNLSLDQLQQRLSTLGENTGAGTGLDQMFVNALAAEQAYAAALPGLIEQQARMQEVADKGGPKEKTEAGDQLAKIRAQANAMRNIWVGMGDQIAGALQSGFGRGGTALGNLLKATIAYNTKRKQIDADYAKADKSSPEKLVAAQVEASKQITSATVEQYASMAGAMKGYFDEHSAGYKVLQGVEQTLRAWQMAMTIKEMLTSLFATETKTAAVVAGKTIESGAMIAGAAVDTATTGVSVANSVTKTGFSITAGVAKAFEQMGVFGFVGAAAILAFMAAMGSGSMSGGGGPGATTFEDHQKTQGTGTVLGDSSAKSESVSNSLKILETNSNLELDYQNSMLTALRNIESALSGAAKNLLQTTGITGGSAFGTINQSDKSFFGADTSSTIADTGVRINGTFGTLRNGFAKGSQYEDVAKTSDGGWFHGNSAWTETHTKVLSDEAMRPFNQIFDNMGNLLVDAGVKLGKNSDDLLKTLNSLPINFAVSLRNLTGKDLTDALAAGISVAFDQVTRSLFPNIQQFQQMGEGLGETLVRVATDFDAVASVFKSMGKVMDPLSAMTLEARVRLVDLSGGLEDFANQAAFFEKNFYTDVEQRNMTKAKLNPVLSQYGLSTEGENANAMFKNFVLGLDTTTAAGAKTYAELMKLAPAFISVTEASSSERKDLQQQLDELMLTRVELLARERAALDSSNQALFDQVQRAKGIADAKSALSDAYDQEKSDIEDTISRISSLSDSWKKFRDSLLLGDKSTLTPEEKYQEAKRQFNTTVTAARGGDQDAQARYEEAANNFLEASRVANSSSETYTADFNQVRSSTDEAIAWAAQQVDIGKASLAALNQQVAGLVDIKVAVMSVADALRDLMARQADFNAHVPPPVAPPTTQMNDAPTQAQMDALIAQLEALRAQQAAEAAAAVDAAHASASEAAQQGAEAAEELALRRAWNGNNMRGTVAV